MATVAIASSAQVCGSGTVAPAIAVPLPGDVTPKLARQMLKSAMSTVPFPLKSPKMRWRSALHPDLQAAPVADGLEVCPFEYLEVIATSIFNLQGVASRDRHSDVLSKPEA